MTTSSEQDVIDKFNLLNKAVPLPLIYTEERASLKRRVLIEDTTSRLAKRYKPMLSTARCPRSPNFNRDGLFESIDRALPEVASDMTVDTIVSWLYELNADIKSRQGHHWPEKAVKNDCYLFCVGTEDWKDFLKLKAQVSVSQEQYQLV
jgi:hypothetical protein